jgi:hypothetical protein
MRLRSCADNGQNIGLILTLKRGLLVAQGKYIYFAAADDFVLPGFFETALQRLDANPDLGLFLWTGDAFLDAVPSWLAAERIFPAWYAEAFYTRSRFSACRLVLQRKPLDREFILIIGARSAAESATIKKIMVLPDRQARWVILALLWYWPRPIALASLLRTSFAMRMRRVAFGRWFPEHARSQIASNEGAGSRLSTSNRVERSSPQTRITVLSVCAAGAAGPRRAVLDLFVSCLIRWRSPFSRYAVVTILICPPDRTAKFENSAGDPDVGLVSPSD